MSMENPCSISVNPINTGSECSDSLKAAGMIIFVPIDAKWTRNDMKNFTTYIKAKTHAAPGSRWYPIFGNRAPIRGIEDSKEADVLETMEDGSVQFIRFGMYNRKFMCTDGGLCLAKALMALVAQGKYGFVETDIVGQFACQDNGDGTFSPFPLNLGYGPAPELATLKTAYKNALYLSFSPQTYVKKGKIFASSATEDLLSLKGLLDTVVYQNGNNVAVGGTRATGGFTIAKGATNDAIDVLVNGVSILAAPVVQTVTENTDTLLAAKVAAAATAAVATNGGYTATNAAGVLTISAPLNLGASINATQATSAVTGTIVTSVPVAFSGGITGTVQILLSVKTECAETDLIGIYGATLVKLGNFTCEDANGNAVVISAVALVGGKARVTIPNLAGTYDFQLIDSSVLYAQSIVGYEGIVDAVVVV